MSAEDPAATIAAFVDAFNAEDLDAFTRTLAPTVEIQTRRGLVRGIDEARDWATRTPSGELHQRLVLDGVRADGHPAVALVRRELVLGPKPQGRPPGGARGAGDDRRGRADQRLAPFDDRDTALAAAGIG